MLTKEVIQGTLKPDGTLELDDKPTLPPGRVQVTVQPVTAGSPTRRGLVEIMDEIRQSQLARGYKGRTVQEMQAEEVAPREEDEEYDRRSQALGGTP